MWKSLILPLLGAVAPIGSAQGVDEINVSKGGTLAGPGLAAHGYDVVAFFTEGKPAFGSDAYALAHGGGTYRFASRASFDAFKANPAKYEPAYGGFCAYGTALGKKFDGDPRFWKIVDGKLYLNLNGDIQAEWSKDIAGNIAKADKNWGRIHGVAVAKL
ncbi:MAG: YHS domain-containing (seleno)protein [Methyloceanibacter sp.]